MTCKKGYRGRNYFWNKGQIWGSSELREDGRGGHHERVRSVCACRGIDPADNCLLSTYYVSGTELKARSLGKPNTAPAPGEENISSDCDACHVGCKSAGEENGVCVYVVCVCSLGKTSLRVLDLSQAES